MRDAELTRELERRKAYDLVVGPDIATDQSKLSEFFDDFDDKQSS